MPAEPFFLAVGYYKMVVVIVRNASLFDCK